MRFVGSFLPRGGLYIIFMLLCCAGVSVRVSLCTCCSTSPSLAAWGIWVGTASAGRQRRSFCKLKVLGLHASVCRMTLLWGRGETCLPPLCVTPSCTQQHRAFPLCSQWSLSAQPCRRWQGAGRSAQAQFNFVRSLKGHAVHHLVFNYFFPQTWQAPSLKQTNIFALGKQSLPEYGCPNDGESSSCLHLVVAGVCGFVLLPRKLKQLCTFHLPSCMRANSTCQGF